LPPESTAMLGDQGKRRGEDGVGDVGY